MLGAILIAALPYRDISGIGYLIAFCEAGIVGGLADWFAVTALFRRPLGLPIPHTAIIERRKDELARSLAGFIREHFLSQSSLERHLGGVDMADNIARWSLTHRDQVADTVVRLGRWLVEAINNDRYRGFVSRHLFSEVDAQGGLAVAGRILKLAVENRHHRGAMDEMLRSVATFIDSNKHQIKDQIAHGSPWWLPGFVDEKIFEQMVERIQTHLLQMVLDPDHPMRIDLDKALGRLADDMVNDSDRRRDMARSLDELKSDPVLREYASELFTGTMVMLDNALSDDNPSARRLVRKLAGQLALGVTRDQDLRNQLNHWLEQAMIHAFTQHGHLATDLITATVRRWDGKKTAARIEHQVGADLQYIRINGTLVGGLIGLLLHAVGV